MTAGSNRDIASCEDFKSSPIYDLWISVQNLVPGTTLLCTRCCQRCHGAAGYDTSSTRTPQHTLPTQTSSLESVYLESISNYLDVYACDRLRSPWRCLSPLHLVRGIASARYLIIVSETYYAFTERPDCRTIVVFFAGIVRFRVRIQSTVLPREFFSTWYQVWYLAEQRRLDLYTVFTLEGLQYLIHQVTQVNIKLSYHTRTTDFFTQRPNQSTKNSLISQGSQSIREIDWFSQRSLS